MNIVIFFQALFVSISLQYLIIESAQSHSLWSRYYLVFDSQLAAVFRSPASLQQAHDFAHKFSLHQSALTYGCSDYITGQRLGKLTVTCTLHCPIQHINMSLSTNTSIYPSSQRVKKCPAR